MTKRASSLSASEQVELGERIARVVAAVGSPAEAARLAGITTKQLGRWTAGTQQPSAVSLGKLAQASGFSLDWILSGVGPERARDSKVSAAVTDLAGQWAGGPRVVEMLAQLVHAGLYEAYFDTGFPLEDEDEQAVLAIARDCETLVDLPRDRWPEVARLLVGAQKVALRHVRGRKR